MQFLTAATLLTLATSISAAALPQTTSTFSATVTVCTGTNFTGECKDFSAPSNVCQQLPAPYLRSAGSFKVASGALCRLTYTADTCTTHGDAFIYPDTPATNLYQFSDPATNSVINAGNSLTSFLCQECTNCTE